MFDVAQMERGPRVVTNTDRDENLTKFGKATLEDRYLLAEENFQGLFARVAMTYGDDDAHAQRLYDYISKLWFMPATPILSNGGTNRGMPISCFLNEMQDSLSGIADLWQENLWLAARGGGIGTNVSNIRSIGEPVGKNGKTSGVMPFIKVMDSQTLAISQGSLRRGSAALYMDVTHPEIEEFVEMRRPTGGDPNRKALNLHHGVLIPDAFMEAVANNEEWALRSPHNNAIIDKISARDLWIRILTARIETGEPYLMYVDTVNKMIPEHHKMAGLTVKMSNLCSEITLPTGIDPDGHDRTAVCCLSSINLEKYDEWHDHPTFVEDIMRMLDNVLQDFIEKAPDTFAKAKYSAMRERSVGLGVMGFHSFLQSKMIPFESVMAKVWNKRMFQQIKKQADDASVKLAHERGPCPDAADYGIMERFSNKMAIAPTASISIICGGASPGIEPIAANAYTHKTLSGSFPVKNKYLDALLRSKGLSEEQMEEAWSDIFTTEGSVKNVECLSDEEKDVFKTAFELDQRWVIEHSADRTPYVCQAQSLNIFVPGDVHKKVLHDLHWEAWKKGVKTLYYCRSKSIQRAESNTSWKKAKADTALAEQQAEANKYDECLACQ